MPTRFKTPEMNWDVADLRDELAKFKQYCNLIFSRPNSRTAEKEQASFILLRIDRQGKQFEQHWRRKSTTGWQDISDNKFRQNKNESVDDFVTNCRNQSSKCRFTDKIESDERLFEQLITETKHKKIQERFLEKGKQLTLDDAIDIARTCKATTLQVGQLENKKKDIYAIKGNENKHSSDKKLMKMRCNNCGLDHPQDRCPEYEYKCMNCHMDNHWVKVCLCNPQGMTSTRGRQRN